MKKIIIKIYNQIVVKIYLIHNNNNNNIINNNVEIISHTNNIILHNCNLNNILINFIKPINNKIIEYNSNTNNNNKNKLNNNNNNNYIEKCHFINKTLQKIIKIMI